MKKVLGLAILLLTIGIFSCSGPKMDPLLIKSMITGYEDGVVCGVSIGDNIEDVKNNIHKEWKLNDEAENYDVRFSKEWDFYNDIILSFQLNDDKTIRDITLSVNGGSENEDLISELILIFTKEFNKKFIPQKGGSWIFLSKKGSKYSLTIEKTEFNSNTNLSISTQYLSN